MLRQTATCLAALAFVAILVDSPTSRATSVEISTGAGVLHTTSDSVNPMLPERDLLAGDVMVGIRIEEWARLRLGLLDQGHVKDGGRSRDLAGRQVHGLPFLYAVLSVRRAEIRIRQREPAHPEVPHVLRPAASGRRPGLRGEMSGQVHDLRNSSGNAGARLVSGLRGAR